MRLEHLLAEVFGSGGAAFQAVLDGQLMEGHVDSIGLIRQYVEPGTPRMRFEVFLRPTWAQANWPAHGEVSISPRRSPEPGKRLAAPIVIAAIVSAVARPIGVDQGGLQRGVSMTVWPRAM